MKGKRYSKYGGFSDRQIGMEPLVIDWYKEEAKMGHIYVFC